MSHRERHLRPHWTNSLSVTPPISAQPSSGYCPVGRSPPRTRPRFRHTSNADHPIESPTCCASGLVRMRPLAHFVTSFTWILPHRELHTPLERASSYRVPLPVSTHPSREYCPIRSSARVLRGRARMHPPANFGTSLTYAHRAPWRAPLAAAVAVLACDPLPTSAHTSRGSCPIGSSTYGFGCQFAFAPSPISAHSSRGSWPRRRSTYGFNGPNHIASPRQFRHAFRKDRAP